MLLEILQIIVQGLTHMIIFVEDGHKDMKMHGNMDVITVEGNIF